VEFNWVLSKVVAGLPLPYEEATRAFRRELVIRALERSRGNMLRSSQLLRIKRSRLYAICSELEINPSDYRPRIE
jgi:DNA-binding NtrC family response regulator